ncbi:DNA-directed RNA polymerase subunit omega [Candidatus Methylacidithermus pantelleriae]|uniref:DNA-directed RNA polymerase subunit omega n=1 Tax=Candidatus Methylacidithermus pantelleriae TaxID=2744239 RepID=A0A8J2BSL6_9BACT|nr:DNA-directed RNA polymerase subunit omega [Candidatus Methylacidithermus pantelleriae]CAF0704500.1 DNA-directed RNA polymerase omega subunit [Candidatus Methylacidithermus pantelleriae]
MKDPALLKQALEKIPTPEILVNVVSRRVRLLARGARPLVEAPADWGFLEIALKEIGEGKLSYELIEEVPPPPSSA